MQEEPTALRIADPGVRALFAEVSRYQAWLDVEAALALVQAELGIIPASAGDYSHNRVAFIIFSKAFFFHFEFRQFSKDSPC